MNTIENLSREMEKENLSREQKKEINRLNEKAKKLQMEVERLKSEKDGLVWAIHNLSEFTKEVCNKNSLLNKIIAVLESSTEE